jgi:hypothetical protein
LQGLALSKQFKREQQIYSSPAPGRAQAQLESLTS